MNPPAVHHLINCVLVGSIVALCPSQFGSCENNSVLQSDWRVCGYYYCTCTHTHTQKILTDRFAKDYDDSSPCSNLGNYCGGTFKGIIRKLDYIQGLGANAIWISPIPQQTSGGYHGYWQMNIDNVNSHFGPPHDLQDLVNECHSRGIWVMLDV